MLRTIVPAAVAMELKGDSPKQQERPLRRNSHMFPAEETTPVKENVTQIESKAETIRLSSGIEVVSVHHPPHEI